MPLIKSGSDKAFDKNVSTLMRDVGKSPKVRSEKQALAIAFDIRRRNKKRRADGGGVDPFEAAAERVRRAAKGHRKEGMVTKAIEAPGKIAEHFVEGARALPLRMAMEANQWADTGEASLLPSIEAAMGVTGGRFPFAKAGEAGVGGGRLVSTEPLRGLPQKPLVVGGEPFVPGPSVPIREVAEAYMAEKGIPYAPLQNYTPVDVPRAKAIASAYDAMPHIPTDRATMRAYDAMARETRDQYEALKRLGVKFEPYPPGTFPYKNPDAAMKDLRENKHLYYFPSEGGFGSGVEAAALAANNPLLKGSGVKIAGKEVPDNDLFRIVHDVLGHAKEGVRFGPTGEENAWRSHARMYSKEALPAMTAETRGQNSWVNYGPFAEKNKGATEASTVYAPQKIGMLPDWVINSGRMTPLGVGAGFGMERALSDREGYDEGGAVSPELVAEARRRYLDEHQPARHLAPGIVGLLRGDPVSRVRDMPTAPGKVPPAVDYPLLEQAAGELAQGASELVGPPGAKAAGAALAHAPLLLPAAKRIARKDPRLGVGGNNPPADAPFAQYALEYPPTGPPVWKPKEKASYPGEMYLAKNLTPEAKAFARKRLAIQHEMEKNGFEPYFDPAKRTLVDQSNYPARTVDTALETPTRQEAAEKYWSVTGGAPEARARLRAAIKRGEELGDAENWYFMGQLERAYIKELGAKKGRAAFLDEFAAPMAATTSGQAPGPNLMMAHYFEYLRKRGLPLPEHSYDLPAPIGGRYAASNMLDYKMLRERGGFQGLGADQPKMLDFSRSYIGDLSRPVVDEQMAEGMLAGVPQKVIDQARKSAYGMLQQPLMAEAKARGVPPGAIQDIAWAGFKNEPGKPMIQIVNEAIERTHRLTGMPKDEIVRRALVRKEIPLYGSGAVAVGSSALSRGEEDGMQRGGRVQGFAFGGMPAMPWGGRMPTGSASLPFHGEPAAPLGSFPPAGGAPPSPPASAPMGFPAPWAQPIAPPMEAPVGTPTPQPGAPPVGQPGMPVPPGEMPAVGQPQQPPWMQSPQWQQFQQAFAPLRQAFAPVQQAFQQAGIGGGWGGNAGNSRGKLPWMAAGGGIDPALAIAASIRRANGGQIAMPAIDDPGPLHTGPVVSDVPGRTDQHNIRVRAGSYVLPSSHVASLAEDNTIGGFSILEKMFKAPAPAFAPMMRGLRGRGRRRRADGGMVPEENDVPIVVAGGEYVLTPEQVLEVGKGDIKRGHEILDAWVKRGRKQHISTLQKLPGPAKT